LAADRFGEAGVDVRKDKRESFGFSAKEDLLFGWRWEMGNNGSGCLFLLRGSRKNVVVV